MTIQRYLLIVILSAIVLATFSAALQGFKTSNAKLNSVFDEEMQSIAFTLRNSPIAETSRHVDTHSSFAFQIWQQDLLLLKSTNAPETHIVMAKQGYGYKSFLGDRWRYYSLLDDHMQVIVAQPMTQRLESIEQVLLSAVLPIVVVIPFIGLVVFFAIRKSFSPITELSKKVKKKDASDLSKVHLAKNTRELEPIVQTINGLLQRLAAAFDREKSLASNAAHELRTPISVLKLNTHNINIAFKSNKISQHHIDELVLNTDRMAHVIEQVIALNRMTPENFDEKKTKFNIEVLLQEVIAGNFSHIDSQQQSISLNTPNLVIVAERFSLYTLFDNLIQNAIKYSGQSSEIAVKVHKKRNDIVVSVEDSGPGIETEQLPRVMQRFYRLKQQEQTGSGLGLSIVKQIVELHQGELKLGRSQLGGLLVEVWLPGVVLDSD